MFYYRITTEKRGAVMTTHREFLKASAVGQYIAALVCERPTKITVEPINQAAYIRATRPGA